MKFKDYIKQNNISYTATELKCIGQGLTDLVGIEKFTKLSYLSLSDNNLTSLPSLDSLVRLKYLNLRGNNLTSLPSLDNLTRLTSLYLHNNHLTSLSSLDNLSSLLQLSISNNSLPENYNNLRFVELKLKVKMDNRNLKIDNLLV